MWRGGRTTRFKAVADPGEGPRGPASPALFLDQSEDRKIFFGDQVPSP